ncbi:hypothetical protein J2T13_002257 [Paenibacillus sp. DS2015]|uniref:DUF6463 family protein n=1 Tax=Paenibacillus sp. DS2015 TaxID=3373917 RepID=UPI003D1FBB35
MVLVAAWSLVFLGVGHMICTLIFFRTPIIEAFKEGFIDKFNSSDLRRATFWFTIFGPLLTMSGHIAVYAANASDQGLLLIIGYYMLGISFVGVLALPKSPMWIALIISPILIIGGYGY